MKRFAMILTTAALAFSLVSCGSTANPDVTELAYSVAETYENPDNFTLADAETVEIVFSCDADSYNDYCVLYSNEPASADIIAIFKSADASAQSRTQEMLETFLENRLKDFKGYAPLEAKKIEASRLITYGRYDILVIADDFSAAESVIDAAFLGE